MFMILIRRYKLELNVVDNTNLSKFIVFGVEAEKIVDASASTVVAAVENRVLYYYLFI